MTLPSVRNRRWLPWAAPAVAVVGVTAIALVPRAFASNPHPNLPPRTPAQVVASVAATTVHAFSGTVSSQPDLGLPKLPGSDGGNQVATLLTEPATWSLAVSGVDHDRLTLMGTGQETDVIHNGSTVWTWDSATQAATHYVLAAGSHARSEAPTTGTGDEASPITLAHGILRTLTPSTRVTLGPTSAVAGRSVYSLIVEPRTAQTLIGKAIIDVDSASGLPLGVTLYPRGSTVAALSEKFRSIALTTPSMSTFTFTPPPGATVSRHVVSPDEHGPGATSRGSAMSASAPRVVGSGWAAVAVLRSAAGAPTAALKGVLSGAVGGGHGPASMLQDATNPGPNGSRLLQTRILTVMVTKDGTVLAGAVPVSRLEAVASQLGS